MKALDHTIIISTRPKQESDTLLETLHEWGATIIECPMITISHISDCTIPNLNKIDYVVFTSKNGVQGFFACLQMQQIQFPKTITCIAIGKATAKEISTYCGNAIIVSSGNTSDDFITDTQFGAITSKEILLVQGTKAQQTISVFLEKNNTVTHCIVYKTEMINSLTPEITNRITTKSYNAIICTSPSAVESILTYTSTKDLRLVCIGNTTAKKAKESGIEPLLTSSKTDTAVFAEEIKQLFISNK